MVTPISNPINSISVLYAPDTIASAAIARLKQYLASFVN